MSRRVISAVITTSASPCAGAAMETMTAAMDLTNTTVVSNSNDLLGSVSSI